VITTTTSAVYGGITDNVPRLDYTDSSCPALLLEPLRSNLWSYSEYVSGNPLVSLPIITENYVVSPEGVSNAFRIQDTTGGSFKRISISSSGLSVSANSTYTQSLFVKKATSAITNYGGIGFDYTGGTTRKIAYVVFDEYNGTLAELTSGFPLNTTLHPVEDYGDYWRFSVSTTDNGSNTNLSMNIYACLSTNGTSAGTGTKDWTGYGLQLEEGSYATSYIPTYGSSVSRVAESNSVTGVSDIIGQDAGTMFIDFDLDAIENSGRIIAIGSGNTNDRILIRFRPTGYLAYASSGGVFQWSHEETTIALGNHKMAIAYAQNDVAFYVDGTLINSESTYTTPTADNI